MSAIHVQGNKLWVCVPEPSFFNRTDGLCFGNRPEWLGSVYETDSFGFGSVNQPKLLGYFFRFEQPGGGGPDPHLLGPKMAEI
jgi:hypothetical protein